MSEFSASFHLRAGDPGVLSLVIGLGCGDQYQHCPALQNGPSTGTNGGSGGGSVGGGDAGHVDLCGCAVTLRAGACVTCNLAVIPPGKACGAEQTACAGSATCTADAQCVGACTGTVDGGAGDAGDAGDAGALDGGALDAGPPEPACVNACLTKASSEYLAFLSCTCTQCANSCSTPTITCP